MAMTPKEIIAVVQHFDAGGEVEYRERHLNTSWKATKNPVWNFHTTDYRPKPKPLEWWCNIDKNGFPDGRTYGSFNHAKLCREEGGRTVHMREVVDD